MNKKYYGKGQYEKGGYEYNKQKKENKAMNDKLFEKELAKLEAEARVPTIEDQREQITKEIEELRQQIEAKQMELLKL